MAMRLTGIGSQYLFVSLDANKNYFDGGKTYKVTLPKGIPAENFWSFTVYDNQTRSMLDTPQRYPRAGSQSFPSPAAEPNADGSTTVYFGPKQPAGRQAGQLDPDRCPARAGSRSCASTARSNRSSRRSGGRARSKKCEKVPAAAPCVEGRIITRNSLGAVDPTSSAGRCTRTFSELKTRRPGQLAVQGSGPVRGCVRRIEISTM